MDTDCSGSPFRVELSVTVPVGGRGWKMVDVLWGCTGLSVFALRVRYDHRQFLQLQSQDSHMHGSFSKSFLCKP